MLSGHETISPLPGFSGPGPGLCADIDYGWSWVYETHLALNFPTWHSGLETLRGGVYQL